MGVEALKIRPKAFVLRGLWRSGLAGVSRPEDRSQKPHLSVDKIYKNLFPHLKEFLNTVLCNIIVIIVISVLNRTWMILGPLFEK